MKKFKRIGFFIICGLFSIMILIFIFGKVSIVLDDNNLIINGIFSKKILEYKKISDINLIENINLGSRGFGFKTIKYFSGNYTSDTYGNYKLYSCLNNKTVVRIKIDNNVYMINDCDVVKTQEMYNDILVKMVSEEN